MSPDLSANIQVFHHEKRKEFILTSGEVERTLILLIETVNINFGDERARSVWEQYKSGFIEAQTSNVFVRNKTPSSAVVFRKVEGIGGDYQSVEREHVCRLFFDALEETRG